MQWDFWTLSPESAHQVMWLMGDRGTPRTWRHMNGYSSHTYLWENEGGEKFWVKYHFKTDQGVECFTDEEAKSMVAEEPDFHLRDLFDSIAQGDPPSWTLNMQIMPFQDAADYRFNPFDLTKVWPHGDYPLIPIGRMVLDRNPENYFAEVEQAAFEPANMVRGIGPSPDKMLLGRLFSYPDTHRYRIGPNYLQLPINTPKVAVHSYNKDGAMRYRHSGTQPVYAPNSFGGPKADPSFAETVWGVEGAEMVRSAYRPHREDDDFGQAGTQYRKVLDDDAKARLVSNIVGHATNGVSSEVQGRVIQYWTSVDSDLGSRVAEGIRGSGSNGSAAANAPQGEEPVGSGASTGL
jgi:catalase